MVFSSLLAAMAHKLPLGEPRCPHVAVSINLLAFVCEFKRSLLADGDPLIQAIDVYVALLPE